MWGLWSCCPPVFSLRLREEHQFPLAFSETYGGVHPERSRGNADDNPTSKTDRKSQIPARVISADAF